MPIVYNVPIKDKMSLLSSFQIVLASDSSKSYVLFKYTKCSYDVLYQATQLFYLSSNLQQMSKLVSFNPCTETNVNLPGTWVFDVVKKISNVKCLHKFCFRIHFIFQMTS